MKNFEFYSPTKVFFGKGEHKNIGKILKDYGFYKIMLQYGMGSIKNSGIYDEVAQSLNEAGISFVEFGGIEANPKLSHTLAAIEICKKENAELVLAVGGGSVIDSAKATASGVFYDGNLWNFFEKTDSPKSALPVATILTIAASGSETSSSSVLTNEKLMKKRGFNSEFNRPLFSILNPELTYSVSPYQTACGIVDIMMHTLERYLTMKCEFSPTDEIAEAILKTTIKAGKETMLNPNSYEARASLMWAGSLSHNDLTGLGRNYFMICHQISHEISGKYDKVAHGAGLAIVFPAWAKYIYKHNVERFCRYAVNVWNYEYDFENPEKTALEGIARTEKFFNEIGMPTRLSGCNIPKSDITEMAQKCTNYGKRTLPGYIEYKESDIAGILNLC